MKNIIHYYMGLYVIRFKIQKNRHNLQVWIQSYNIFSLHHSKGFDLISVLIHWPFYHFVPTFVQSNHLHMIYYIFSV